MTFNSLYYIRGDISVVIYGRKNEDTFKTKKNDYC